MDPKLICDSEFRWFHGVELSWEEFEHALAYLEARELLRVEHGVDGHEDSATVNLTPDGSDIVRDNITVRERMEAKNQIGAAVRIGNNSTFVGPGSTVSGTNIASGNYNAQVAAPGIDPTALAKLISELRTIAPKLGLEDQDNEDLLTEVTNLQEAGSGRGEAARPWRYITRFLKSALNRENVALAAKVAPNFTPEHVQALIKAGDELFRALP